MQVKRQAGGKYVVTPSAEEKAMLEKLAQNELRDDENQIAYILQQSLRKYFQEEAPRNAQAVRTIEAVRAASNQAQRSQHEMSELLKRLQQLLALPESDWYVVPPSKAKG